MKYVQNGSFPPDAHIDMASLFDQCTFGIGACNYDGTYLFANRAYAALYGYEPDELIGRNFMDIKTTEEKRLIQRDLLRKLLDDGNVIVPFEKWDRRRDGTEFLARYEGDFLRNADGKAYGAVVFVKDVTEQRQMEESLRKHKALLEQSRTYETLGRIAGGVIHDFNNRLNVILGLSSTMRLQGETDPDRVEMLGDIISASRQAADLTQKLLTFSRQTSGATETVSLANLVDEAVGLAKRLTLQPVAWYVGEAPESSFIMADKTQIQNVIFNIMLNALEAMPQGGEMHLLYNVKESELDSEAGQDIELAIRDTGQGMSAEVLSRIFDPFFSTKLSKKGTGLGLAAAKQTIEEHGGAIHVESEPGAGTTVYIQFPLVEGGEECANSALSIGAWGQESYHVMVVDDEADVLSATEKTLKALGHICTPHHDPLEAKEWYCRYHGDVDLVLLDVMLPSMSGVDLMRELLAICPVRPIVLMSGYAVGDAVEKALAGGAKGFLRKPFSAEELAGALEKA